MPDARDKTNFRGPFSLHLLNLLRTIRRSRQTVAVRVHVESGEGTIYFDKGKLVHAESSGLSGEEAFRAVVLMRDGSYEKIPDLCADVVSIERDTKILLGEAKDAIEQEDGKKRFSLTLFEEVETEEEMIYPEPASGSQSPETSQPDETYGTGPETGVNEEETVKASEHAERGEEGEEREEVETGKVDAGEEKDVEEFEEPALAVSSIARTYSRDVWHPSHTEGAGRGFQEELWMTDWGSKTPGFIAARIVREDGVSIMRALDASEELSAGVTKNVIDAAKQFTGDLEELLMESSTRLYSISHLADGYYMVLALDRAKADLATLEDRLAPLIKALKESLELA